MVALACYPKSQEHPTVQMLVSKTSSPKKKQYSLEKKI